jgi:hypothetical protein
MPQIQKEVCKMSDENEKQKDDEQVGSYLYEDVSDQLQKDDADQPTMTPEQALARIKQIRSIGSSVYNKTAQAELEKLYPLAYPEKTPSGDIGLEQTLKKAGLKTAKEVEAMGEQARERVYEAEAEKVYQEANAELIKAWGSDYKENLSRVHFIVDNVLNPEDRDTFIEKFGNDVEMCNALAYVASRLDEVFWKGQAKNYKRSKK